MPLQLSPNCNDSAETEGADAEDPETLTTGGKLRESGTVFDTSCNRYIAVGIKNMLCSRHKGIVWVNYFVCDSAGIYHVH